LNLSTKYLICQPAGNHLVDQHHVQGQADQEQADRHLRNSTAAEEAYNAYALRGMVRIEVRGCAQDRQGAHNVWAPG